MVDEENAQSAAMSLRMIAAGLAEEAIELVAQAELEDPRQRVAALEELEELGWDMALAAGAAAMALKKAQTPQK